MGPARLRLAVRPPGDRHVAPGDGGRPRDAAGRGGGRRQGGDPRAVAGGHRPRRSPPAVPRRRRRRPPHHRDVLRRGAVRGRLLRARLHRRCRPVRARARRATARRRRSRTAATRRSSSRPTASCTATTSRSATCSSSASSRPKRGPGRSFDVVGFHAATAEARRPPAPRDPDPRPDLVELPPRRAPLDRRVPGRPGRPLEGAAARGARTACRRHRQRDGRDRP